ncbi:hypothetical protein [Marinigracilibium pacificum]|uniref:Lipoprotein n=1 Tax=Marinigracilibium pacificum TaxID=2729599 RepID=A0A848IRN8_9BACT|nr:hypothetical protein [Marinigracilibium pacificum]NMM47017.1 hypothetical protein [Marinigracilibium pacificum]
MKSSLAAILIASVGILSCQIDEKERQKLSEVQRQMEKNELVKVSREDIFSAAQKQSVFIGKALRDQGVNELTIDSLEQKFKAEIVFLSTDDLDSMTEASSKELEVFEAYKYQFKNAGQLDDNVQFINNDQQLAYDFPVNRDSIEGIWHVVVSRKDVILEELNK